MTFSWDRCSGAARYGLMVRRAGSGSYQQLAETTRESHRAQVPDSYGGTVDWYVVARAGEARVNSASPAGRLTFITLPPPNDARLTWTDPITQQNFPGLASWPAQMRQRVGGSRSIQDIVESRVVVRSDNARCSACHFDGTGSRNYMAPVAQSSSSGTIGPTTPIRRCRARNCPNGTWSNFYAQAFVQNTAGTSPSSGVKPDYLRQLFEKWIADGRRP